MNRQNILSSIAVMFLLMVSGVAFSAVDSTSETAKAIKCVKTHLIRSSKVIDDQTVVLSMMGKKKIKMSLTHKCSGLKFHKFFGYKTHNGRLCDLDVIFSKRGSHCAIDSFEAWVEPEEQSEKVGEQADSVAAA